MAHKLQVVRKCQIYEAIEMTETYVRLMDRGGGNTEPAGQLVLVSIANPVVNLSSKITVGKTWHTNCKKSDVSKILDWLVL